MQKFYKKALIFSHAKVYTRYVDMLFIRPLHTQPTALLLIFDLLAKLGVEGDVAAGLAASALVEHVAGVEGRRVDVQGHRSVGVRGVRHSVEAQGVIDVAHPVAGQSAPASLPKRCPALPLQLLLRVALLARRPVVAGLLQVTVQDLHEAVGVGVVVDAAHMRRSPAQHHEVEATIAFVQEVTGVLVSVKLGKLLPVGNIGFVRFKDLIYIVNVDVVGGEGLVE